jgi:hypothetical protein
MFVRKDTSRPFIEQDVAKLQRALAAYQARVKAIAAGTADGAPYKPLAAGESVGRPVDPTNEYFPGRPADAPEPNPGERPEMLPSWELGGGHLGGSAVDNSHSTTQGLVGLAINQMGLTQDLLARVTSALDEAEAVAVASESQIRTVQSLVMAAVGTGEGAPPSGEQMAEHTALAVDTISGDASVGLAVHLAKVRAETANNQILAAVANAQEFLRTLS